MTSQSPPDQFLFRHFRIAVLLYILLFVALGQYLTARRSTDWNDSLWVDVYPVNGSGTEATQRFIDSLPADAFVAVEQFFEEQIRDYGLSLERPFRIRLADQLEDAVPPIPAGGSFLSAVLWSLKMRWFVVRLHWASDEPTPDITLFAIYQDWDVGSSIDRSTALRKGMIVIANLFAEQSARGSNQMIVAHELLHTLGATDKYDPSTNLPSFPAGFADPDQSPAYPQRRAELMAGRIPIDSDTAEIPQSLLEVTIGPLTAREIGWTAVP
jgi:hypothetical protein